MELNIRAIMFHGHWQTAGRLKVTSDRIEFTPQLFDRLLFAKTFAASRSDVISAEIVDAGWSAFKRDGIGAIRNPRLQINLAKRRVRFRMKDPEQVRRLLMAAADQSVKDVS